MDAAVALSEALSDEKKAKPNGIAQSSAPAPQEDVPIKNKSDLPSIDPDYVIQLQFSTDPNGSPTKAAEMDLARLIKVLDTNKFYLTLRADVPGSLLAFVKCNNLQLLDYYEKTKFRDWAHGVNNNLVSTTTHDMNYNPLQSLSPADRLRLVYELLTRKSQSSHSSIRGCGITPNENHWKFVRAIVPVKTMSAAKLELENAKSSWSDLYNNTLNSKQIEFVTAHFGTKVGFYFHFLNYYLNWMFPLIVFGVISNFIFGRFSVVFCIVNILWGVSFVVSWKWTSLQFAIKHKVVNVSQLDTVVETDEEAFNNEPYYKILLREVVFTPVALLWGGILVLAQFLCFGIEIFLTELYDGKFKSFLSLVPTILICSIVPVLTVMYSFVCDKFLHWENHSKKSTKVHSKTVKMFAFNFLTSYMALLITSFVYLPLGFRLNELLPNIGLGVHRYFHASINIKQSNYEINKFRLDAQYVYFVLTNQIIALAMEFGLPLLMEKALSHPKVKELMGVKHVAEFDDRESEKVYLKQVRQMLAHPEYDVNDDYRQLVMQFGLLMMFGPVWSLGPLISTVVNLFQQKMDYVKVLSLARVSVPERSESIFPWDKFAKLLLYVGAFVSTAVTLMYTNHIISSADHSAVGNPWYVVLGGALIVEHVTMGLVIFGEKVVGSFDQSNSDSVEIRRRYANGILTKRKVVDSDNVAVVNNVDDLLKMARVLARQVASDSSGLKKLEKKGELESKLESKKAEVGYYGDLESEKLKQLDEAERNFEKADDSKKDKPVRDEEPSQEVSEKPTRVDPTVENTVRDQTVEKPSQEVSEKPVMVTQLVEKPVKVTETVTKPVSGPIVDTTVNGETAESKLTPKPAVSDEFTWEKHDQPQNARNATPHRVPPKDSVDEYISDFPDSSIQKGTQFIPGHAGESTILEKSPLKEADEGRPSHENPEETSIKSKKSSGKLKNLLNKVKSK